MHTLAEEIIAGRRLTRSDDLRIFLTAPLEDLADGADRIRQALCGHRGDLCSIVNARSGRCSEDCKFCAQSCHYHTKIDEYPFLDEESILNEFHQNREGGVHRFSMVTAGRNIHGADLEKALAAYRKLREEGGMELCASHGLQTVEEFRQLKESGVSRAHINLEACRRYFEQICSTHTYDDKLQNIARAREAGLEVCSGGIIGMGETWEDRLDLAVSLAELRINSIPINVLRPIPGTPLGYLKPLSNDDVRRTVAFFRYINPTAFIRMAAGRGQFPDGGEILFRSGANSAITGDMLTTTGTSIAGDVRMFQKLGYTVK